MPLRHLGIAALALCAFLSCRGLGLAQSEELEALKAEELHQAGRYAEAIPVAVNALALAERLNGPDHPAVGTGANSLAELYRAQGRYAEAEPLLKRALSTTSTWFIVLWVAWPKPNRSASAPSRSAKRRERSGSLAPRPGMLAGHRVLRGRMSLRWRWKGESGGGGAIDGGRWLCIAIAELSSVSTKIC
jgi:tetratricopeptide (TPR) repeat protein